MANEIDQAYRWITQLTCGRSEYNKTVASDMAAGLKERTLPFIRPTQEKSMADIPTVLSIYGGKKDTEMAIAADFKASTPLSLADNITIHSIFPAR